MRGSRGRAPRRVAGRPPEDGELVRGESDGACAAAGDSTRIRRNVSPRRMVDSAGGRLRDPVVIRGLRDVGRVPEWALHVWAVPLAVLRAGAVRQLTARVVRAEAGVVARVAALLSRAADPAIPGTFPLHVLLLPRRVLQGLLG